MTDVCYNRNAMSEKIKNFLRGAGTVLQIGPSTTHSHVSRPDFMRKSVNDRIASDWARVGTHLHRALAAATHEGVRVQTEQT